MMQSSFMRLSDDVSQQCCSLLMEASPIASTGPSTLQLEGKPSSARIRRIL